MRQAEVTKGTSDVALLRAVQAENEAKLDLLRRMGVEPPVSIDQIVLTDSFPVTPPSFRLDSLLALSDRQNPVLRSLRARGHAARLDVRAAKTDFLPTLSLRAGWSGFTQQFTNQDLLLRQNLTDAQAQAANCEFDNAVRTGLSLGGQTGNCFSAAGLIDGGGALARPGGAADPQSEQRISLLLHRAAVRGQPDRFPAHLHRLQPIASTLAGPSAGR